MHKVALIGTQGSGKTVFITTLAHHLTRDRADGIFLDPQNPATLKYTESNWRTLNRGEWPAHTSAGGSRDLLWHLKDGRGATIGELRVVDASGHDLRIIFGNDDGSPLHETLGDLAAYCNEADIAIFLVNLDDYVNRPDSVTDVENEAILKEGLDSLARRGARSCIVLSQADRYATYLGASSGTLPEPEAWVSFLKEHMPIVYGAYFRHGAIATFPVACVNAVETRVTDSGVGTVPKPGFASEGLEYVETWIIDQVTRSPSQEQEVVSLNPPPKPPPLPSPWPLTAAGGIAVLVFFATCSETIKKATPGGWSLWPPFYHGPSPEVTEFNFVSIPIAVVAFFLTFSLLVGIQWIIGQITKHR